MQQPNRAEWLRSQRKSPTAVWMEYILAHARYPDALFAFVEGKDDGAFYLPELRRRWRQGEVRPVACEGKPGVLAALERLTTTKESASRALFFCDKDLDDFLGLHVPSNPLLFVTAGYSVENYLVTEDTFRIAWTDLFRLPISDARLDIELRRFHAGLHRFHKMCKPLMAWVLYHRLAGSRLNLSQIKLSKLAEVSSLFLPKWRHRDIGKELRAMCHSARPVSAECLRRAVRQFGQRPAKEYVRGKFELWFFAKVLQRCLERLSQDPPGARPSCSVNISEANALEVLSGRGRLPDDVEAFLTKALDLTG